MKKYISPTVVVRHISTENILLGWSILIDDDTPKQGIHGEAKRTTVVVDDSDDYDDLEEQENSILHCYDALLL